MNLLKASYAGKLKNINIVTIAIHADNLILVNIQICMSSNLKKSRKTIGIDQIREFLKWENIKPVYGHQKAVCIKNFESLTESAQNAMLKVLEEPSQGVCFFLTSASAA